MPSQAYLDANRFVTFDPDGKTGIRYNDKRPKEYVTLKALHVLAALRRGDGTDTDQIAWPTALLMKLTGVSRSGVLSIMKDFEEKRAVEAIRAPGKATFWVITLDGIYLLREMLRKRFSRRQLKLWVNREFDFLEEARRVDLILKDHRFQPHLRHESMRARGLRSILWCVTRTHSYFDNHGYREWRPRIQRDLDQTPEGQRFGYLFNCILGRKEVNEGEGGAFRGTRKTSGPTRTFRRWSKKDRMFARAVASGRIAI